MSRAITLAASPSVSSPTSTLMSVGVAEISRPMLRMKPAIPPSCVFEQRTRPFGSIIAPVTSVSVSDSPMPPIFIFSTNLIVTKAGLLSCSTF